MSPLILAIPAFKAERFVAETLQSLNAEGDAVRWWLQDAASPDRTAEIGRALARPGDTVVSEPDGGQADALNRAFARMGGEIVGFINADDRLSPGAAKAVLEYFAEHPEIDLVYGETEWMDEGGTVTGRHTGRIQSLEEVLSIYEVWWQKRQWVQPEVFYRRSLWERAGGFKAGYHLAFDYDFWVRCFLAGARVAHLPRPLAQFRLHAAQKSSASLQAAEEIRAIVKSYLEAPGVSPGLRRRLRAQLEYDEYANLSPCEGRKPFLRELLTRPNWLFCPEVRSRLGDSLRSRLGL